MLDEQYNPEHCNECDKESCLCCGDSFKAGEIVEFKTFLGPYYPTGERYIVQYAQQRARNQLTEIFIGAA